MSEKRAKQPSSGERWNLRQRRVGLGLFLVFLACGMAGSHGPWWTVHVGEKAYGPQYGNDYRRWKLQPQVDEQGRASKYVVEKTEQPLRPANIALLALVAAFLIGLWDLVADATLMWPLLICALVVAAVAGYVVKDVVLDESILKEFVDAQQMHRILGGKPIKGVSPTATLQVCWGLALFVSSALVLLLDAIALTVIARRAGKST